MARKYIPDIHSSVISNVKDEYKKRFNSDLKLSDELIWITFDEWSDVYDPDNPDDKYAALYCELQTMNSTH